MASYNKVTLVGNLTRDPELKQVGDAQICRLGLATNRKFKHKQTGAIVQDVCFVDVMVWGKRAESCHKHLSKGRSVLVEGHLKFDEWKDQSGQSRSKLSVVAEMVVFIGYEPETTQRTQASDIANDPDDLPFQ